MQGPFRESSRYNKQKIINIINEDGSEITALTLRIIPHTTGVEIQVKRTERLDIISQVRYNNPTKFWHIADANTELEATKLIRKNIQTVEVPEQ